MRFKIITVSFLACSFSLQSTAQNKEVRAGNKLYAERKYPEAAAAYQKALIKDPTNTPGMFNMGNALYRQKNYGGARQVLTTTAKRVPDKNVKAQAQYNIGNTYMEEKKWQDAVDAYKQTLRNNPQDEEAKYNLSYALEMLKQQNGGGGKDKNQDKDKQNKDQQNKDQQDKKDQEKDKKDQEQQNQDKDPQKKQEQKDQQGQQPQPSKWSEQQADQLLNALSQEEKKLHDKKEKGRATPVKIEKDW